MKNEDTRLLAVPLDSEVLLVCFRDLSEFLLV